MNKEDLINRYLLGKIDITQFQFLSGLKRSQSFKVISDYKKYGHSSLRHALTGKPSNFRKPSLENLKDLAIDNYIHEFKEYGPTLASEYLLKYHQIRIHHETLRKELIKRSLWKVRKRKRKIIRIRRTPKDSFGELIQYDGSYHKWFGNINSCLLLAVDDATSKIVKAVFSQGEGLNDTLQFWKEYVYQIGKPQKIYLDKFSTYKQSISDNPRNLTTFQKVCQNLEISLLFANSPQAKGRVERKFGNLQDRLIKHLKYLNVTSLLDAQNELPLFIEEFNQKFSRQSVSNENKHTNLSPQESLHLNSIFSEKHIRKINNDFTISFQGKILQLLPIENFAFKRQENIQVEIHTDQSIHIFSPSRNIFLDYKSVQIRPKQNTLLTVLKPNAKINSPWRKTNSILFNKSLRKIRNIRRF